MDERLPQYLHKPVQILWFDQQEFVLVAAVVLIATMLGGMLGWLLVGALLLFIPWKRTKPRGYIPHLAYRWGLLRLKGYPGPTHSRFYE